MRARARRQAAVETADLVAIPNSALCELAWVLSRNYRLPRVDVAEGIRKLVEAQNVAVDSDAVRAGLAQPEAGGDFADGVIAHEGRRLGADVLVSFDRKAVSLLEKRGEVARLLR